MNDTGDNVIMFTVCIRMLILIIVKCVSVTDYSTKQRHCKVMCYIVLLPISSYCRILFAKVAKKFQFTASNSNLITLEHICPGNVHFVLNFVLVLYSEYSILNIYLNIELSR